MWGADYPTAATLGVLPLCLKHLVLATVRDGILDWMGLGSDPAGSAYAPVNLSDYLFYVIQQHLICIGAHCAACCIPTE